MSITTPPAAPSSRRSRSRTVRWTVVAVLAAAVVAGVAVALVVAMSGPAARPHDPRALTVPGTSIATTITFQSRGRAQDVRCADVPLEAGASTVCTATVDGRPAHIRATITSTDVTRSSYSFQQID